MWPKHEFLGRGIEISAEKVAILGALSYSSCEINATFALFCSQVELSDVADIAITLRHPKSLLIDLGAPPPPPKKNESPPKCTS